jgi:uncharacterized protein (DUF1800 family)
MFATKRIAWISILALAFVTGPAAVAERASAVPSKPDDRIIAHVLNRLGFGAAPGDLERVRRMGLQTYIDQQLAPERIEDARMRERLDGLETLTMPTRAIAEQFADAQMKRREQQRKQAAQDPSMAEQPAPTPAARRESMTPAEAEALRKDRQVLTDVMQAKILRAAYSERQLEEVMVDFWFNHFNVFSGKGPVRVYLHEYERDVIRPHVLGKFQDLLKATAESPAMLFYLDNWQSSAPEGAQALDDRSANRPLGRNPGRFPRARPGQMGRPATLADLPAAQNRRRGLNENYARELMELHTLGVDGGYTQKDVQEVARAFTGWTIANPRQGGSFRFEPRMHDAGAKVVLGRTIGAGGGKADGDAVLTLLAKHPATARFISTKLARRFVADDPPKALVDRAAQRFRETDGDIREVVRTIVTAPEFFAREAYRAKVKTPFDFVVSAVRATGLDVINAQPLVLAVRNLGMPIYGCQPPTGYADTAEAWVNSGALLNRMNFAVSLTSGRSLRADAPQTPGRRAGAAPSVTRQELIASGLAGDLSESTAATIAKSSNEPQALALVLGSPEFQRK